MRGTLEALCPPHLGMWLSCELSAPPGLGSPPFLGVCPAEALLGQAIRPVLESTVDAVDAVDATHPCMTTRGYRILLENCDARFRSD